MGLIWRPARNAPTVTRWSGWRGTTVVGAVRLVDDADGGASYWRPAVLDERGAEVVIPGRHATAETAMVAVDDYLERHDPLDGLDRRPR
jgi:hypothetical protein